MKKSLTRRQFAATAAAATLAGCHTQPVRIAPAHVSISRAAAYGQDLYAAVRAILDLHGIHPRGRRVLLKPNLVEFEETTAVNTHPLLVHAAMEAFLALGAAEVRIAEGPGHRRNTLDLADAAGYFQIIPRFEERFVDLNVDEVTLTHPARPFSRLDKLYLPQSALSADLLVSMPKMKTHHWAGATLSMKNLFGVVPSGIYGWPKNVLHWAGIHESIADLHAAFPRQFALVDGIVAMEGNGPIQGSPTAAGLLVAGRDPVAVDATCCRIMGIDPLQIRYLQLAARGPARLAEENVRQIGDPIPALAPFELPPALPGIRLRKG